MMNSVCDKVCGVMNLPYHQKTLENDCVRDRCKLFFFSEFFSSSFNRACKFGSVRVLVRQARHLLSIIVVSEWFLLFGIFFPKNLSLLVCKGFILYLK